MASFFRIRRFRTRLLLIILGLLFAALSTSYLLVTRANRTNAQTHIEESLNNAMRVFWFSVNLRQERLAQSAQVMVADWPIRELFFQDELDRHTLKSVLVNYARRLQVPIVAAFDTEGELLASKREFYINGEIQDTNTELTYENCETFRELIFKADKEGEEYATGFAYLDGELHVLMVVPLYAPRPNILIWFAVTFPIDDAFATELKRTTQAEVSFISGSNLTTQRVLGTTLPMEQAQTVVTYDYDSELKAQIKMTSLDDEPYVTLVAPLGLLGDNTARIALQRSLTAELEPSHELEDIILLISIAALILASIAATAVARGVSKPVQELAAHTELIAQGDYETRLAPDRSDEFGQLAESFNRMTDGLAERDKVRDLLDKNVSPEIAAQLMRDGAALGGEEREVTILFADLRGFTPLSENLAPRELIELLNDYLERMSSEIERHGGVIDKFIGDAIMAVFGAPLKQEGDADHALQSALAMERALETLNSELEAAGRPKLGIGIGINTARVIAGNIGSHRRLNYSVIGDGVNVAARLEALTRIPEYSTNILVSAATIKAAQGDYAARDLGSVTVKGRQEPVAIFALENQSSQS